MWKSLDHVLPAGLATCYGAIAHLPWSPHPAASDSCLFGFLKKHLAGKRFKVDAKMKQAVTSWLQTFDTGCFYARIQIFAPQWDKCLNVRMTAWVSGVYHLLLTCHVYTEVKKFSTSESLLPYFFVLFFTQNSILAQTAQQLLAGRLSVQPTAPVLCSSKPHHSILCSSVFFCYVAYIGYSSFHGGCCVKRWLCFCGFYTA
jgi:hypothetical protein